MAEGDENTGTHRAASTSESPVQNKSIHRLDDALEEIIQTLANERDRFGAVLGGRSRSCC